MKISAYDERDPHLLSATELAARSNGRERRLRLALGLNLTVALGQVVAGVLSGSLGLLADAGHGLTDVAAVLVTIVSLRLARRAPTATRSFGMHRVTILAALANAAALLAVTAWITVEGVRRLFEPVAVNGGPVLVAAGVGLVANAIAAAVVHERHGHDLNMRSAALHLFGDAAASAGVAVSGAVIIVTGGWYRLDPLVSLAIAALLAVQAWRLLRASVEVLLEAAPTGLGVDVLRRAVAAVDGVEGVHDVHVWSLSSEMRALSAHVVLAGHPTLEEAQVVGEHVKAVLGTEFGIAHATLELECESCAPAGADPCGMTPPVLARPTTTPG